MWETALPAISDDLRQGDLLAGVAFPRRGSVRLTASAVEAELRPGRYLVVLERCCTVENQGTVMVADVRQMKRPKDDSSLMKGLLAGSDDLGSDVRPTLYQHLLAPHGDLAVKSGQISVIDMLNRVSLIPSSEDMQALRDRRIARMTPYARAQLRWKLTGHFGQAEQDDVVWLREHGYDDFGRALKQ